jgi:hypothetical protein
LARLPFPIFLGFADLFANDGREIELVEVGAKLLGEQPSGQRLAGAARSNEKRAHTQCRAKFVKGSPRALGTGHPDFQ